MAHCLICNGPTDHRRFGGRFFYCPDCDFHFADRSAPPAPETAAGYGADYYQRGSSPLDWMFRVFTALEQRRILSAVRGSRRVLDIGCGSGWMAERLQRQGAEAYGVDTSEAAIALAGRKVEASRLRRGTLAEAGFETGFFDAAVAVHVLEHVEEPAAFAREARRILKEGGTLLLRIPNMASLEARLAGEQWYHFDFPFHVAHYSPRAVTRLLEAAGFREARIGFAVTEYRQALLYAVLSALGIPLPFWLKLVLLPLQLVFMPLSWLLALLGNSGTIEVIARK
jgi:SAM-dependent methyltransferase